MTTRVWSAVAVCAVAASAIAFDLNRQARAARRLAQPASSVGTCTFADPRSGIALCYPAAWQPLPAKTAELAVAAPAGRSSLSLDVPAMGWHPPFIPVGLVTTRYVDALKQDQLPDAAVQETVDLKVAGATARRVTTRGHGHDGAVCIDTAIVIVHSGQVYILSCDSDDAGTPVARHALDAAAASVRWTK
jgi:hypothetical protein